MAENDILKVNSILDLGLTECMNFLSYRIERDRVIEYKNKRSNEK
ncbi:MAG: hypothetical protein ACOCRX_07635 [Candidatus Woesearchaeota archaeon]